MIGKSPAINQLQATTRPRRRRPTAASCIRGASGSGKELAARVMHQKSQRDDGPFVVLNAAAMAPDRVEEELFGTEDRTGGPRKVGALEEAHGGTLYIDEVADMPLETQGKVLRVLVEQKFLRHRRRAEGVGRRAHHLLDQPRPRARDAGGPLPRGPLSPPQRRAAARAEPRRAPRRHPGPHPVFRRPGRPAHRAWLRAGSERMPSPCCRPTIGRATCASSATTSSG